MPLREGLVLYGLVMLGSMIGGVARAAVALLLDAPAPGLPWATLAVNVLGSFAIGLYAGLSEPGGRLFPSARQRQFVMTGLCGGFTTFSLFGLETLRLLEVERPLAAAAYVALSVMLWLAAGWGGYALAGRSQRLEGG